MDIMSVAQAIRAGAERLAHAGGTPSDTPRMDAEWLMAEALGCDRSTMLLSRMNTPVPPRFEGLVERRVSGEPLAYVLGQQSFFGRDFVVSSDVLIPRADSEAVVAAALQLLPANARILDCGTGSGALLLTLLSEADSATGIGIDSSPAALDIASTNIDRHALNGRAELRLADWTKDGWASTLGQFDMVIANPPYVETGAVLDAGVRDYEPHGALFAGSDGLDDYRILIPHLPALVQPGGVAVLEIGWEQADAVEDLCSAIGASCELVRDLAQRPRGMVLRFGLGKGARVG